MKKILKNLALVFPIAVFLVIYASIPDEISAVKGQSLGLKWGFSSDITTDSIGRYDCSVKLFGIPVKTVSVSVDEERYLIPSGESIGIKLYADGVLVVGMGSVYDEKGVLCEPAKDAGLKIGDRIVEINSRRIVGNEEFVKKINDCRGQAVIKVIRGKKEFTTPISGVYSPEGNGYKLGLWVRDSTAGIGTMTFYNPENGTYGALGHGICDSDTNDVIISRKGSVNRCKISSVIKGKNGTPGELVGVFGPGEIGSVVTNCSVGVFGKSKIQPDVKAVKVASRYQVREGAAELWCDIDENGVKAYKIEITKIITKSSESNKDFVIKVTDDKLLETTGGIVQGMSGSPILQDGKIVGAVTHVFINDSSKGYGIFVENMLSESEKIK